MSSLFAGPSSITPWIEDICFRALIRGPEPQQRPRLAQVLARRLSSNQDGPGGDDCPSFLVIHDGKTSAIAFLSDDAIANSSNAPAKGCIVRISKWNVSLVEHCAKRQHIEQLRNRSDQACYYLSLDPRLCLHVRQVETLGAHDIGIVGNPLHVHQSLQVRRALQSLDRKQKTLAQQLQLTTTTTTPLGNGQKLFSSVQTYVINTDNESEGQKQHHQVATATVPSTNNQNTGSFSSTATNGSEGVAGVVSVDASKKRRTNSTDDGIVLGNAKALLEGTVAVGGENTNPVEAILIAAQVMDKNGENSSTIPSSSKEAVSSTRNNERHVEAHYATAAEMTPNGSKDDDDGSVMKLGNVKALFEGKVDLLGENANPVDAVLASAQAMDDVHITASAPVAASNRKSKLNGNGNHSAPKYAAGMDETSKGSNEAVRSTRTAAKAAATRNVSEERGGAVKLGNVKALFEGKVDSLDTDANPVEVILGSAQAMGDAPTAAAAVSTSSRKSTRNDNSNSARADSRKTMNDSSAAKSMHASSENTTNMVDDHQQSSALQAASIEPYDIRERLDSRASVVSLSGIGSVLKSVFGRMSSHTESISGNADVEQETTRVEDERNDAETMTTEMMESQENDEGDDSESDVVGISDMLVSQTQEDQEDKKEDEKKKEAVDAEGTVVEKSSIANLSKKRSREQSEEGGSVENETPTTQADDDNASIIDDAEDNGIVSKNRRGAKKAKTSQRKTKRKEQGKGMLRMWKELRSRRKEKLGNEVL